MTKVIVPPIIPGPIPEDRFAQNGDMPSPAALRRVAWAYNHANINQRKVLFAQSYDTQGTYAPLASGETTICFTFRTGENVDEVAFMIGMAPASATSTTNKASCELILEDGTNTLTSARKYYPKVQSGAYQPSEVSWTYGSISVSAHTLLPNTRYIGYLNQWHYARVHSICVYEKAKSVGVSSVTGVADPLYWEANKPIYDAGVQDLAETGTKLWQHNGCQLLSIGRDSPAGTFSISSTTASNLYSSATAWAATERGFILNTQYHDTQKGDVPVEFAVSTRLISGTGNLVVSLEQNGSQLLTTTITGTSWSPHAVSTHTIPAQASTKTDVFAAVTGTAVYEIDCIGLWEYEA